MNYRIAKYAALACTIFWATGVARYAHECIEHGAGIAQPLFKPLPPANPFWNEARDDDDQDCPTCSMLTMMLSPQIVEPPPLDWVGTCIEILTPEDHLSPVLHLVGAEYARGPPASFLSA
jgi:hypothetical protein